MTTLLSNKAKKKTSKTESKNCLNLNEAFEIVGQELHGENWDQMKISDSPYHIVDNLNDMIRNDFFDVYDGDDFDSKEKISKKPDLVGAISHSEFLTRIRNKDESFILVNENHDEVLKINYSAFFPKNFLIPKEQFDYVLKTGKRWMDQMPKKEYGEQVVSEKQSGFRGLVIHEKMLKVGSRENLLSYAELSSDYQKKFEAPEWEVDLWISLVNPNELVILQSDEIDKDGYAYFNKQKANDLNYTKTFYLRAQNDSFTPERFVDYQGLVRQWQKFGISEEKITQHILNHLSFLDAQKLLPDTKFYEEFGGLMPPIHKTKHIQSPWNLEDVDKQKAFIKESAFALSYIKAMEEKYFSKLQIKSSRGRKQKYNLIEIWREFVEVTLEGNFDESLDFVQQASSAFYNLSGEKRDCLGFIDKNRKSPFRKRIITKLSELKSSKSQGISDRTLGDKIADKFIKKIS